MIHSGMIFLWSGTLGNIPAGYALCDGNNGTPNLKDTFVVGAGATYTPGDTGGAATHTHDFTTDGHSHDLQAGTVIGGPAPNFDDETTVDTDSGTTDNGNNLPPYYALAYIMFL